MLTGIHEGTFERLQLGPGVFLAGFDPDKAGDAEALRRLVTKAIQEKRGLIGATKGGGVFRCVPALRQVEADGLRGPRKGGVVNDGWNVRMTGTMLEITPENFARTLAMADVVRTGCLTTVTMRADVKAEDYLDRLCWVGDTSRGAMLIEMTNALNMNGAAFSFSDRGEGVLPFEFQAHSDGQDDGHAPCRILFFDEGGAIG